MFVTDVVDNFLSPRCRLQHSTTPTIHLASPSFQIFWQNVYYDRQPPAFDARYENIVWHTTEEYPGFKTPTIEVDVMFQIVSINECMSF